jgi:hypothetical protein
VARAAAGRQGGSLFLAFGDVALDLVALARGREGSHLRGGVERVADHLGAERLRQGFDGAVGAGIDPVAPIERLSRLIRYR